MCVCLHANTNDFEQTACDGFFQHCQHVANVQGVGVPIRQSATLETSHVETSLIPDGALATPSDHNCRLDEVLGQALKAVKNVDLD